MTWGRLPREQCTILLRLFWHPDLGLEHVVVLSDGSALRKARTQLLGRFIVGPNIRRINLGWMKELEDYWHKQLTEDVRGTLSVRSYHVVDRANKRKLFEECLEREKGRRQELGVTEDRLPRPPRHSVTLPGPPGIKIAGGGKGAGGGGGGGLDVLDVREAKEEAFSLREGRSLKALFDRMVDSFLAFEAEYRRQGPRETETEETLRAKLAEMEKEAEEWRKDKKAFDAMKSLFRQ